MSYRQLERYMLNSDQRKIEQNVMNYVYVSHSLLFNISARTITNVVEIEAWWQNALK